MCAGYLWQSLAEVRSLSPLQACDLSGARGRNRTGTVFLPRDFKSLASTNFATRAYRNVMEAEPGIEPGYTALQAAA